MSNIAEYILDHAFHLITNCLRCCTLPSGVLMTSLLCHTGMSLLLRNVAVHGILLDDLFSDDTEDWLEVADLVRQGMLNGQVQPLQHTDFGCDEVEGAFRYMAQGKHVGKVTIRVGLQEDCFIFIYCVAVVLFAYKVFWGGRE